MRNHRVVLWAACLLLTATSFADETATRLRAEIKRLRTTVEKASDAGTWKEVKPMVTETLDSSEAALARGRLYLGLMELGRSERLIVASSYSDRAVKDDAEFERQWAEERAGMLKYVKADNAPRNWNVPLAIRALEEGARGQAMPTIDAAKAYAPVTELKYGLYYMGEAQALANFSNLLRGLHFAAPPGAQKVRSIEPELRELQSKANAAFKPPLSRDKHSEFIRLNSMLKLASELDEAGLYAGSWYAYLIAVTQYSTLNAPAVEIAKLSGLRERTAAELKRPAASGVDDSLRRLFVEQAEEALLKPSPTADDLSRANAILNDVLPAYEGLVRGATKSAPPRATQVATVTLVRWPYT